MPSDVFTKTKRSEIMFRIRGSGNKAKEMVLVKLFRRHGIPRSIYTDALSLFGPSSSSDHSDPKSEFQRALRALEVAHLVAPTPQGQRQNRTPFRHLPKTPGHPHGPRQSLVLGARRPDTANGNPTPKQDVKPHHRKSPGPGVAAGPPAKKPAPSAPVRSPLCWIFTSPSVACAGSTTITPSTLKGAITRSPPPSAKPSLSCTISKPAFGFWSTLPQRSGSRF